MIFQENSSYNVSIFHEMPGQNGPCGQGGLGGKGGQMEDDFMVMWIPSNMTKETSKLVIWYHGATSYASMSGVGREACTSYKDQVNYLSNAIFQQNNQILVVILSYTLFFTGNIR